MVYKLKKLCLIEETKKHKDLVSPCFEQTLYAYKHISKNQVQHSHSVLWNNLCFPAVREMVYEKQVYKPTRGIITYILVLLSSFEGTLLNLIRKSCGQQ